MKPIEGANFGNTAADYVTHRAGFPKSLFAKLTQRNIGSGGQRMLDLGTGTGTLAREFALAGNQVTGIDPASEMLDGARQLDQVANIEVEYIQASAEQTGLPSSQFDIISAGQCWHWFNPAAASKEIIRLLKPDGRLVIAHYDWLPLKGNMVRQTEKLIEHYNPAWKGGNQFGMHPQIFRDLGESGFHNITSFTYDEAAIYTHEAWRGRIRASAGVSATLSDIEVQEFDAELAQLLDQHFPDEPMQVPHRVFVLIASPPQ